MWGFKSVRQYIANSGQEFVHCLVEEHEKGEKGEITRDDSGNYSKKVHVRREMKDESCIQGSVVFVTEQKFFTKLFKGTFCTFKGKDLDVTLISSSGETYLDCYPIPNGKSILVKKEGNEVVGQDAIEREKLEALTETQNMVKHGAKHHSDHDFPARYPKNNQEKGANDRLSGNQGNEEFAEGKIRSVEDQYSDKKTTCGKPPKI